MRDGDMNFAAQGPSAKQSVTDRSRSFFALFDRLESADRDVSFVLQVNEPGRGTESGAHDWEQWFFVHRGQVRFFVGDQEVLAGPGDFVYVPRNVTHRHEWLGDSAAELLVINHWPHDTEDRIRTVAELRP
jgi:quercetin dioxygenase-like cupin family protein